MSPLFRIRKSAQDDELTRFLQTERSNLLQYACYRLGSPEDAEDALQDLFLKFQSNPTANAPIYLPSYVYHCLRNLCTDRMRNKAPQLIPMERLPEVCEETPEDFTQEVRRIETLLSLIPEVQAEVIRLRFYGNQSFASISQLLVLPPLTIKSRFRYGMEKIRNELRRRS